MRIHFIEIQNFRKLKSVRIDFAERTTLFVGANNSGKTSAMVALRLFLIGRGKFSLSDFTLSNWANLNSIGQRWESEPKIPDFEKCIKEYWAQILPSLDLWIQATKEELHYVSHILPSLKWAGEPLGIRFRFQPQDLEKLYKDYLEARSSCKETLEAANKKKKKGEEGFKVPLWPRNLQDFLGRSGRLASYFSVSSYILDPEKLAIPKPGEVEPQELSSHAEPLTGNPLSGLIQIDDIDAQRGFSDVRSDPKQNDEMEGSVSRGQSSKLSGQLRQYYEKHLDPSEQPDPDDIEALEGIFQAQESFNVRLKDGFADALGELEDMGYPGLTDPKLTVLTKIEPLHSMTHSSEVHYDVIASGEAPSSSIRLPEQSSGLGYQNLISIIFRLIAYRDSWMKVGKAGARAALSTDESRPHPPLHLVLLEEPEAHLHTQVQQVFIRKAYEALRNHKLLGDDSTFTTQLVVSTHSNHIVYECDFSALRYFRRLPAADEGETPVSQVVNLTDTFGKDSVTEKFETRYIRTTHCDLFFADAVVLVEGAAERMFLPHFLRAHFNKPKGGLYQRYLSILEIGGSHAHRLRPLIEALALPTLVITDIDSGTKQEPKKRSSSAPPTRDEGMVTMNHTLKDWLPQLKGLDKLLDANEAQKILRIDQFSSIRVAYQSPVMVEFPVTDSKPGAGVDPVFASTFEDALVLENIEIFRDLEGHGLVSKFRESIAEAKNPAELITKLHNDLKGGDKGKFALDVIFGVDPAQLIIPDYIRSGLSWLEKQLESGDQRSIIALRSAAISTKPEGAKNNEAE